MEIAQLNQLLLELSPSEQRYREGEAYDWARPRDCTVVDGRQVLRMDQGVDGSPRYLDATVGQGAQRPMADLLLLRRNSRFNPVPEHIHSHIEISYVYAGSCPQTVNGRAMTLRENQVLLLDTNCPHSIGSLGESDIMMSLVLSREFLRDNLLGSFTHESMLAHFIVTALNDVFLHNLDLSSALRYRVRIDGELYANEVVGDGVGISSVHGSTAYYRSITHSIFRVGIGLAFSNSTEEVSHLVLDPRSTVEIEVVRGPGILIADNSPDRITVPEHGVVRFFQSEERASIYGLSDFMCPACRALRHPSPQPRPSGWLF